MAKKRFTDNLFGLFEEPLREEKTSVPAGEAAAEKDGRSAKSPSPEPPAVGAKQIDTQKVEVDVPTPSPRARRKLSSKGFTADLDAFLSDSFERESARPSPAQKTSSAPASAPAVSRSLPDVPRSRRRKTGLDLLLQSTVTDEDRFPHGAKTPDTKRVTLIFNKEHLVELKTKAKKRGVYLKDVVQEMVSDYLNK